MTRTEQKLREAYRAFFPYYTSAGDARCFNCRAELLEIERSGYAHGRGDHVGRCPVCNMRTWFDLFNAA